MAAASLLTVTRTSSEPARARAAICWTVDSMSAVSVLVIDWTTTGAEEPVRMPPMLTVGVGLRVMGGIGAPRAILAFGLGVTGEDGISGKRWMFKRVRLEIDRTTQ